MKLALVKKHGVLLPGNDETEELIANLPKGTLLRGEFKKARNPAFLRKFFALLDIGYEAWEPADIESGYGIPQKNREAFREQVIILAGFYDVTYGIDGHVKLVAKSIAFHNMDEDEFALVFSNAANVLLQKVLTNYSRADLDEQVERILGFV